MPAPRCCRRRRTLLKGGKRPPPCQSSPSSFRTSWVSCRWMVMRQPFTCSVSCSASRSSLAFRWALRMWAMPSPSPWTATLPAVVQLVPERLHLLYPLALVDHLFQRGAPAQMEGDEAAGKLGDAMLEAAALAQEAEDLEGLAVLVYRDGDEEASELCFQLGRGAGQAAGPVPCLRGHRRGPSARQRGPRPAALDVFHPPVLPDHLRVAPRRTQPRCGCRTARRGPTPVLPSRRRRGSGCPAGSGG